jgi:CheY-like chemotaxis protein
VKVLLVDDDPDYHFVVTAALGPAHAVSGVLTADQAAAAAQEIEPDLVLVDASMRGAFAAIPSIRDVAPAARIALTSIRPAAELAAAAAAAGAVGYVSKDLVPSGLPGILVELHRLVGEVENCVARLTRQLPAEVTSPALARRAVSRALVAFCDDDTLATILLCLSEVVTNAVVHGQSAPSISVEVRPAAVHVEVRDTAPELPAPEAPAPDATSGRGLAILDAAAERWGTRRHTDGGKTIWFDVGLRHSTPLVG